MHTQLTETQMATVINLTIIFFLRHTVMSKRMRESRYLLMHLSIKKVKTDLLCPLRRFILQKCHNNHRT